MESHKELNRELLRESLARLQTFKQHNKTNTIVIGIDAHGSIMYNKETDEAVTKMFRTE